MVTQSQTLVLDTAAAEPTHGAAGRRSRRGPGEAAGQARRGLLSELRAFAASHPGGWDHDGWLGLLETLSTTGHDTADADAIGLALERERLALTLAGIRGLGERRRTALLDRFPRLWDLQRAGEEEIARLPGMNAGLARRIAEVVG